MKLIRLSTDDPKLYFNNTIQSDLTLPPKSKIGLLNCNFEKKLNSLVVNHINDQVSFYLIDTEFTSGNFTHGTYSEDNITVLLKSMGVELNNALTITMSIFFLQKSSRVLSKLTVKTYRKTYRQNLP